MHILRYLTAVLASVASATAQDKVTVEPTPAWVEAIDPTTIEPTRSASGGVDFLLVDQQVNATLAKAEWYHHTARLVTNTTGVQSQSQVAIDFDPSREHLVVHAVRLVRGGLTLDRLRVDEFQLIREERNFDRQLLDGARTALLILHDVRVGDVIDVSYTLRTEHSSFGERHVSSFPLVYTVPIGRVRVRLVTPIDRQIAVRLLGGEWKPEPIDHGDAREYLFDVTPVPALAPDSNVPSWVVERPLLQASEYEDWDAVARWAEPLFKVPEGIDPVVQNVVDQLRKASPDVKEQARFALRFVQNDVRYLGVHLGSGAYEPSPPAVVINRRFGDCKDKALLLTTLLHELGVEAAAALVSTSLHEHLTDFLPSPTDFDHVIVRFTLDGKTTWVDPTSTHQAGSVNERTLPEYGKALIVSGPDLGLVDVVLDEGDPAQTTVLNQYTIALNGSSQLTVRSTFQGSDAEGWRAIVASLSSEDLERVRLEYRQRAHSALTRNGPVRVEDDLRHNRLVLTENYSLANFWDTQEPSGTWGYFTPLEVLDELVLVDRNLRRTPVALDPARHVVVTTVATLPVPTRIDDSSERVDFKCVRARSDIRARGQTLTLECEYQAFADHVAPRDVAQYRDRIEQFRQRSGYGIPKPTPVSPSTRTLEPAPNVVQAVIGLLFLIAMIVGIVMGSRAMRRMTDKEDAAAWSSAGTPQVVEVPGVWRRANVLVIERGSALPKRCVVCNAEASSSVERRFRWHTPALYFTILGGLIVYAILGTVLSKRAVVKIGLCDVHLSARRKWIAGSWVVGLGGLVMVFSAAQIESLTAGVLGGACVIFAVIYGQKKASIMTVKRIDDVGLHVQGAGHSFLETIERRAA